jgi:hypothetical protein
VIISGQNSEHVGLQTLRHYRTLCLRVWSTSTYIHQPSVHIICSLRLSTTHSIFKKWFVLACVAFSFLVNFKNLRSQSCKYILVPKVHLWHKYIDSLCFTYLPFQSLCFLQMWFLTRSAFLLWCWYDQLYEQGCRNNLFHGEKWGMVNVWKILW